MDQWVQKLAVAVILLTAGASFYATKEGIACWCPSHFTESMVHYTETICSNEHHNETYPPPSEAGANTALEHARKAPVGPLTENTVLLKYLAGEFLLAGGLYSLIKCIMASSSMDVLYPDAPMQSHRKAPMYIIVQVIGGFLWVCFAVLTHNSYNHPEPDDKPFMCDFEIHQLGRILRWTVQCVEEGEEMMSVAIMANMGLCIVVAFSKLIHLVSIFMVQPIFRVNKVASKMMDHEIRGGGAGFWLSDFYFALLAHGSDASQLLALKGNQDEKE